MGRELNEKCAVFAAYGPGLDVARLAYYALYALQHRGQESSGIVTSDGRNFFRHAGRGLVATVYQEQELKYLHGDMVIGHNRYSTSGATDAHVQPILNVASGVALAHNGNLPSTAALEHFLDENGVEYADKNDSEMMEAAISYYVAGGKKLADAVERCYELFTGAFACTAVSRDQIVAFRDPKGIRPLSLGKLDGGWVVASETCAFDTIGAAFLRDVLPGEMIIIDKHGLRSRQLSQPDLKLDVFEYVYFARPDSFMEGRRVGSVRRELGVNLANEHPIKADVVVPMPDSAIPAALGYAGKLNIPFDFGLIKNRYIHRSFIRPNDRLRQHDLHMKLNPVPEVMMGKHVALVDDSIVRGNTLRKVVKLLYGAGAARVSVLISSPPVKYPDFYGIDTPKQSDLIAANMTVDEIREHMGCDDLYYLSYDGMIAATGLRANQLSTSCFDGVYPVDIHERRGEFVVV